MKTDTEEGQAIADAVKTIEWTLASLESRLGAPITDLRIERTEVTGFMNHVRKFERRVVIDFGPCAGYGWESVRSAERKLTGQG